MIAILSILAGLVLGTGLGVGVVCAGLRARNAALLKANERLGNQLLDYREAMDMTLNRLAGELYKLAVERGTWEKDRSFADTLGLCRYELLEAIHEYQSGEPDEYVADTDGTRITDPAQFLCRKPEGVAVEMADCLMRILEWFGARGLDVEGVVGRKLAYNRMRLDTVGKEY